MAEHQQPIPKTVFISYRRTNFPWALCIFQYLTHYGFDVFFDFEGLGAGDFESIILGNLLSRAHFLVVLTPSALERCDQPGDWLRREIETAIESKRNIVPLMIEGFSFSTPAIATQLTGKLAELRHYNGLGMPAEYFLAAMEKLRTKFLTIHPNAILHPPTPAAERAATEQRAAAEAAPPVEEKELTAQECLEQGIVSKDPNEKIRLFNDAIRLSPEFTDAYLMRGIAFADKGKLEVAIHDYNRAIQIDSNRTLAYVHRGIAFAGTGKTDLAIKDFDKAIQIDPKEATAYMNRSNVLARMGKYDLAIRDVTTPIEAEPTSATPYYIRASHRILAKDIVGGIADYQRYLDLGGGERDGDTAVVQQRIAELRSQLSKN